jgi:hypothetical protein
MAVIGGIVAGLAAFGIGETSPELIPAEPVQYNFMGQMKWTVSKETPGVQLRIAALTFGLLGTSLGVTLGIAGGLARRAGSAMATTGAGLLGAVLGIAIGGGISLAVIPPLLEVYFSHKDLEVIIGLLTHIVIWGPLGAAAGLAFAVGLGERPLIGRALVAGLLGAVIGTLAFDLVGALAFPLAKTDALLSLTWPTRLLARLLVSLGTGSALAFSLSRPTEVQEQGRAG